MHPTMIPNTTFEPSLICVNQVVNPVLTAAKGPPSTHTINPPVTSNPRIGMMMIDFNDCTDLGNGNFFK